MMLPEEIDRALDRDDTTGELRGYINGLHQRLAHLDGAVAEFLDADSAWNNDECDESLVVAAQNQMKRMLYASRQHCSAQPQASEVNDRERP